MLVTEQRGSLSQPATETLYEISTKVLDFINDLRPGMQQPSLPQAMDQARGKRIIPFLMISSGTDSAFSQLT